MKNVTKTAKTANKVNTKTANKVNAKSLMALFKEKHPKAEVVIQCIAHYRAANAYDYVLGWLKRNGATQRLAIDTAYNILRLYNL